MKWKIKWYVDFFKSMFNAQEKLIIFISRRYFPLLLGWVLLIYCSITCFQQSNISVSSWTQSTSLFCFCLLSVAIASKLGPLAELFSIALHGLSLCSLASLTGATVAETVLVSFLSSFVLLHFFNCSNTCQLVLCFFSTNGTLSL